MKENSTVFEQRWSLWMWGISGITLVIDTGLALWIQFNQTGPDQLQIATKSSLITSYNNISHGIWITVLLMLTEILIRSVSRSPSSKQSSAITPKNLNFSISNLDQASPGHIHCADRLCNHYDARKQLVFQEILTWHDDIYTDHLLNNFSFRQSFIAETMRRNDFRFFRSRTKTFNP
jgi:hypothetical protein